MMSDYEPLAANGKINDGHVDAVNVWRVWDRAFTHVRLFFGLAVYVLIGGLIFRHLESPALRTRLHEIRETIARERHALIGDISNSTDVSNLRDLIRWDLERYEMILERAFTQGYKAKYTDESVDDLTEGSWSVWQAVFFAATVLTTIGYGNIVPLTDAGKLFCVLFALIGIPFMLIVIADWGVVFATLATPLGQYRPVKWLLTGQDMDVSKRTLYALSAVVFLFIYLAIGAGLFTLWEDDWTFLDGFYFCFITMTTIGFGDLVPKQPKFMLLCTMYILIGLALTSTIIELVRRQYAHSWRQLQALSGPLADVFRRIGESGTVDITALQQDLRRVLAVVSVPKWSTNTQREWNKAMEVMLNDAKIHVNNHVNGNANGKPRRNQPKIVQIVIYESSV